MKVAVVGAGVIGAGWAARFLLMGWDVAVSDPDPEAERKLNEVLANARAALPGLHDALLPAEGSLSVTADLASALEGAQLVVEAVPERLDLKHSLFKEIQAVSPDVLIASSTSGFTPTSLQEGASRPENILVAHPFNPVYLLPLVEVVASTTTPLELVEQLKSILTGIGMYPLHIRAEIDGHVADRLLEAVWREALWLVRDGIATTGEIDEAIRMGFGLRWAQMGLFETYRIAGGEAGMRHFLAQFGPALKWPWTKLMDVPDLDDALIDRIADQSDAQAAGRSVRELERVRDANLVAILRALTRPFNPDGAYGAGLVLREMDARLDKRPEDLTQPFVTFARAVPSDWTDYNGHMTEARYLDAFGRGTDRFMEAIGCGADYIATGGSFFTVETHIRHLGEIAAGTRFQVVSRLLGYEGKKMHLWHELRVDDEVRATGEHMLVHVSLETRRAAAPGGAVAENLTKIWEAHQGLPMPEGAGRFVGQGR